MEQGDEPGQARGGRHRRGTVGDLESRVGTVADDVFEGRAGRCSPGRLNPLGTVGRRAGFGSGSRFSRVVRAFHE
ncbi:hypothetical protein D3C76_1299510 [compost metagenome]